MGKRKRKKRSSTLTWKAIKGSFRLLFKGILKATPLFLFAVAGFLIFWGIRVELYADSGFQIQTLEIVPQGALSPAKAQELAKRYLNQNLLKLPVGEVAALIEQDPKIREARVSRQFPKTLRIEILDRNPFAQVTLKPKGPYYSVAEDGVLVNEEERNKNLLLIEATESESARLERGVRVPLPGFMQAVALARAFWEHPLSQSEAIEKMRLDHLGNVSLVLKDGPELRFGRDPLKKMYLVEGLRPLLKGKERKQIVYMELQYNDLVVKKK